MTKEEIRNMIIEEFYESILKEIDAYRVGLDKAIKGREWGKANEFESCIYNYINARECAISAINKVFDKIEVDNESVYKEMWTELKEKIGDRVKDHFLTMGTNIDYLKKAVSEIRHEEAGGILWEMKNIEEKEKNNDLTNY